MDKQIEKYLDKIDKKLKPLPASERIDIVKEIKSTIIEMQNEGLTTSEILAKYGGPEELARAYLGDLIYNGSSSRLLHLLTICAFYSLAGFSGMFIIPVLGITAFVFILSGATIPVMSLIKLTGSLFNIDIPYIIFSLGPYKPSPLISFIISIPVGFALLAAGKGMWKLLLYYIRKISSTKKSLSI